MVTLTFRDGQQIYFPAGSDSIELDLDGDTSKNLFQIAVHDFDGTVMFSAYHWHNQPKGE